MEINPLILSNPHCTVPSPSAGGPSQGSPAPEAACPCQTEAVERLLAVLDDPKVIARLHSCPAHPTVVILAQLSAEQEAGLAQLIQPPRDPQCLSVCAVSGSATIDLNTAVTSIILEVGIPTHVKGYQYLREAIVLVVEDPEAIRGITKILYPQIARDHGTTSSSVERAIRHAIELACNRGALDTLRRYFGYSPRNTREKPTNSEFISLIADKLQLQLRSPERACP